MRCLCAVVVLLAGCAAPSAVSTKAPAPPANSVAIAGVPDDASTPIDGSPGDDGSVADDGSALAGGARRPDRALRDRYHRVAEALMDGEGLESAMIVVVDSAAWRGARRPDRDMAETLGRALFPGVAGIEVEARGEGFCARSAVSSDCMFVTVVDADGRWLDPASWRYDEVEAVIYVEPGSPDPTSMDPSAPRMAWRAELRTARLILVLRPREPRWDGTSAAAIV